jgi:phage terminase large subunit-like protein
MVERGTDILNGVISDERAFYYLATLDKDDDVNDPACWVKANPNLGISVRLEDMVEEWEQRKSVPAERADFITKRLNVFVCSDDMPFVTFEILKRNSGHYDLGDLDGRPCVGGYDLSNNEDLTAAALEFPLPESKLFVLHHSWVPQAKVDADNEKVPYRVWEDAGWLTIVPGEFVDHTYVYDWFTENARRYQLLMVTYDPANAYRLNNDLEQWGGAEWTKATRQGALTLSPPLKDIKTQLISGNVLSNDDPMLRWYTNNVKLVIADRNGNWLPTKQQGYRKIDGFAAWLNAHTQTMLLPPVGDPNASPVGFISRRDLKG